MTDRSRLRAWWNSPEGECFQRYLAQELIEVQARPMKGDFDLSDPRKVYEAARCQGESRRIKALLDENKLLTELERSDQETYNARRQ